MATDDLTLRIVGVEGGDEIEGARPVTIRTTRGDIRTLLHATPDRGRAVICVSGAIGGMDGPAALYARLGLELPPAGVSVLRVDYRAPGEFGECVLDTMAGLSFLKGTGHDRIAIVGHSFGGAVAINAGTLSPAVKTVIAISSQLAGAHVVSDPAPRPLLLIHGTADTVLSCESSQALYERAQEPKVLKLFDGADHRLSRVGDELYEVVKDWIIGRI
jgi:alpha/beta superfamily hydrolase